MPSKGAVPDSVFVELCEKNSAQEVAAIVGMTVRGVFKRRRGIEAKLRRPINFPHASRHLALFRPKEYPHRHQLTVETGCVIVAGDAHYWPGPASLMHKALIAFCKEMKPAALVYNGDVLDFPQISRHPPIGWTSLPTVADEIEAAQERLSEVERAAFKTEKIWNLGNHDSRLETRLATVAPEFAKLHGVRLHDHFPNWKTAWSTHINDSVIVKHRFKSGIHATHNNALWAGRSMITGHLHSAKVTPLSDWNGTRYGVDGGCIADTDAQAFVDYTEDAAAGGNWRSAFVVLTFKGGLLLHPELVLKWNDDSVQFRGEIIKP
jgi:hypothetical protein